MKQMKKEVDALTRQLKALTQEVEKIVSKINRPEKPQAKPKAVKKAAKPKKPARKPAAEKTPKKPAETKTAKGLSDSVLVLIQNSPEGLKTDQIMKQTGLDKRQVWGVVSRAKKQGKLKTIKRGIYVVS